MQQIYELKVVVLNILTPYEFEVTIIAERGFKSIDLFKFIDETLKWKYCIRCTKDMGISIAGKRKIKKLDDITSRKGFTKYFYNIKLTAEESEDVWFIANNISESYAPGAMIFNILKCYIFVFVQLIAT